MSINIFYLFGIVADLLKYDYNKDFGIFDYSESKRPVSFQLLFIEFFTLQLISCEGKVSKEEETKLMAFVIDMLDFVHLNELPNVLREGVFCH